MILRVKDQAEFSYEDRFPAASAQKQVRSLDRGYNFLSIEKKLSSFLREEKYSLDWRNRVQKVSPKELSGKLVDSRIRNAAGEIHSSLKLEDVTKSIIAPSSSPTVLSLDQKKSIDALFLLALPPDERVQRILSATCLHVMADVELFLKNFFHQNPDEKSIRALQQRFSELLAGRSPLSLISTMELFAKEGKQDILSPYTLKEALKNNGDLQEIASSTFPYERDWLSATHLREKLAAWNESLEDMLKPAEIEVSDNKITLKGSFPKISQLKEILASSKKRERIEIFALHTATIDADLIGDNLRGVDLVIIAPKWDIQGKRKIDLTGPDCLERCNYPAGVNPDTPWASRLRRTGEDGLEGNPGKPGGYGGHFFGIGKEMPNLEDLAIITSGGRGGQGQNGENGTNGAAGANGNPYPWSEQPTLPIVDRYKWDNEGFILGNPPPIPAAPPAIGSRVRVTNFGQMGQKGGNGGAPGGGGRGGFAGTIVMVNLEDQKTPIFKSDRGEEGSPGTPGECGAGGLNGYDLTGVYEYRWPGGVPARTRIRERFWIEHPSLISQPHLFNNSDHGPSGQIVTIGNVTGIQEPLSPSPLDIPSRLIEYKTYLLDRLVRENKKQCLLTLNALESFSSSYESDDKVKGTFSLAALIGECNWLEKRSSESKEKIVFHPFYESILQRLIHHPSEDNLYRSLYTAVATKISQLQAIQQKRLVVEIGRFLDLAVTRIGKIDKLDKEQMIESYKNQFVDQIEGNIEEAAVFIDKLHQEIHRSSNEINEKVKKLLKEIEELQAKGESAREEAKEKITQLENEMNKKFVLGLISVAVTGLGCCFPPAGPFIAGAAVAGISIYENPSGFIESGGKILESAGNIVDFVSSNQKKTHLTGLKEFGKSIYAPLKDIAIDFFEARDSNQEKLAAYKDAILKAELLIQQLGKYREQVKDSFGPSLLSFVEDAEKVQTELEGKSIISRTYSRFETKNTFETFQQKIEGFLKDFSSDQDLINIIKKVEGAITTSMDIYDRVQDYRDRITMVKYMANLAAPGSSSEDPNFVAFKLKVKKNLLLQQYGEAMNAARQWSFPFSESLFGPSIDLRQFGDNATYEEMVNLVKESIEKIREDISDYASRVNPQVDNAIMLAKFDATTAYRPFYVWEGETYQEDIEGLLRGEEIILNADVNNSPPFSATKFTSIGLEIRCRGNLELERELNDCLKNFTVVLHHTGNSFFRYGGALYRIPSEGDLEIESSFQKGQDGLPIAVGGTYSKLDKGVPILSPYTTWGIKLEPIQKDQDLFHLFTQFKEHFSNFELHLVGQGLFVKEYNKDIKIKLDPQDSELLYKG